MHLEQLYTGLASLVMQQEITVELKPNNHPLPNTFMNGLGEAVLKLRIENGPMLLFDTHDNFTLFKHKHLLDDVDYYFKRSYRLSGYEEDITKLDKKIKVLPLGFNYSVYSNDSFLLRRTFLQKGLKKKIEWFSRGNRFIAQLLKLNTSIAYADERYMHQLPSTKPPRILLMTRLWSTDSNINDEKKEKRLDLNNKRIAAIRILKKNFPTHFTGGLFIDAFSQKTASDILLSSNQLASKKQYLQQLSECSIGVTINGRFSAGWTFGENIAFSNALVADGVSVQVPGNFQDTKNFMDIENADGCLKACERLFTDHNLREEMHLNNFNYYNQFLKPAMLIRNAIDTAIKDYEGN